MQCLYVCLFSNGHIKVGRSINPTARIASHADRVACIGVELVDQLAVACENGSVRAETALIEWCDKIATKRNKSEWFEGLDFDQTCAYARMCAEIADIKKDNRQADVVEHAAMIVGGQVELAKLCGVGRAAVTAWKLIGSIPAKHVIVISQRTGIPRQELRPDDWRMYWPELAELSGVAASLRATT